MVDISLPDDVRIAFWGPLNDKRQLCNGDLIEDLDLSTYMDYYTHQWTTMVIHADGRYVTVRTYENIAEIVHLLLQGDTRESIMKYLRQKDPGHTEDACGNSINLAARLLLMLNIGDVKHQVGPRRFLAWEEDSLKDLVKEQFSESQVLDTHNVRLSKSFNAWAINVIGGLRIRFTDNLADHLLLVDDDTKVLIFHHVSFLECQQRSLFPQGLVEEILRTLALLFPQSEFSSLRRGRNHRRVWFRKICPNVKQYKIDPRIILCGSLRAEDRHIERFNFWRDRLIILKQAYDESTPKTASQWWHDRRNGERWSTFWVAILVLIITTTLRIF
ncbi:hypothetical protein F5B20DRAFT_521903 [Whalleya microplaca]|nr:hypothetical protein F5B20DRAFT_521903 [Whalleya microplaca]